MNIEAINAEIEKLKNLSAEDYCAEKIAHCREQILRDFEDSRESRVNDLETALRVHSEFAIPQNLEEPVSCEENYEEV